MLRSAFLSIFLLFSYFANSEGSKNLTPTYGSGVGTTNNSFIGYLCHSQEGGITGNFLRPGVSVDERLYVYVRQGETLYMGLRRIDPVTNFETRHQDLTIVIRQNDGTLVTSFTLDDNDGVTDGSGDSQGYPFTTPQQGVIESYAEVLAGPAAVVGPTGYDALSWVNNIGDQEYYIEFIQFDGGSTNPADDINVESWYDLWDFSVYDANEEKPGRLHSKNWGFSAGSFANQFSDDFQLYVTVPSTIGGQPSGSYIKMVDFAGIQPYTTMISANATGADVGSSSDLNGDGVTDFQDARRTQGGNIGGLEYDIFLNNPDIEVYPTTTLPSITITDANFYCNPSGTSGSGVITFTSNQSGIITIILDLNGVGGFQDGTSDVIIEQEIDASSGSATSTIYWDGLDGNGVAVPSGTEINISGRFTSGSLHVPLYDPEINSIGINMIDVRPATSFDLIYWDDRSAGGLGSPSAVQLDGTNSEQHTWTDGNALMVNTWSYGFYQINTQNVTFAYVCDPDGDGISGATDLDSDNDGLPDTEEGDFLGDDDADNVPNYLDEGYAGYVDSNNDGINDNFDDDLDGIPNAMDLDADNDGIPDITELGLADANNDGLVDTFVDANGNGLNDAYDPACDGVPTPVVYASSVTNNGAVNPNNALGAPDGNFANLDATNDYITLQFGQTIPSGTQVTINMALATGSGYNITFFQSADGAIFTNQTQIPLNGGTTPTDYLYTLNADATHIRVRSDGTTARYVYHLSLPSVANPCSGGAAITIPDTDGDGVPNHMDLDSDNDGITDAYEAGGTAGVNGQISGFVDANKNGRNDQQEIVALPLPNTDGDALADYLDIDSDNDGIVDNFEAQANNEHIDIVAGDTNGNGLLDSYDPNNGGTLLEPVDTDSDASYDFRDSDSDGDGVTDLIEGWDANFDGFGDWDATGGDNDLSNETGYNVDSDGDGLWDVFDNTASTGIANIIGSDAPMQNTDGADLADWQDEDDDNDGSLTSGEDVNGNNDWTDDFTQGQGGSSTVPDYLFRGDYDGDGIADATDSDSDNDGIKDTDEANGEAIDPSADADGDGIPNFRDADIAGSLANSTDSNGDGVFDVYDTDLDGVPDFLDLDSDNDGIWDAVEAYAGSVPNGLDQTTGRFALNDPDNDGLMNYVDSSPASAGGNSTLANPDTDGDGVRDYLDTDSDGDGIRDIVESQSTAGYIALSGIDTDGDGIDDAFDPSNGGTLVVPVNTDGLDLQDYLDSDSDNDNVPDSIEGNDANRDGVADTSPSSTDADGDGLDDTYDPDQGGTLPGLQNSDGIDQKDWRDTDDDNDGILTINEDANDNGDYSDDNTNGQGISQIPDYLFNGDFDGDGVLDFVDLDDDNDGILDSEEGYENVVLLNGSFDTPAVTTGTWELFNEGSVDGWETTASDGQIEFWLDGFNGVPAYDGTQFVEINANEDAQLYQDVATEPGTLIYWTIAHRGREGIDEFSILIGPTSGPINNGTFATGNTDWVVYSGYYQVPDGQTTTRFGFESINTSTGDPSVGNLLDNFALYATQSGGDEDGDGLPDYLDRDSNNNGIPDIMEAGGADSDGDGEVDAFADTDGDGLHDLYDADNGGTSLISGDTDGDGISDVLDLDSDNDGIPDIKEAGGIDADGDGRLDDITDSDSDGFADLHDTDNGGTALTLIDTDYDLVPDFQDLDSDNDGITDASENGGSDTNYDGWIDGYATDSDGDGLADEVDPDSGGTPITNVDTDGDGLSDYRDLDSDNDGLPDIIEAGGVDADNDGRVDEMLDIDLDGIPANVDVDQTGGADVDGDGIDDTFDVSITGGNDDDGDGIDNIYDRDKDGDGLSDAIEANPFDILDSDGDGNKDFRDLDSDNDGIVDVIEFGLAVNTATGTIDGFTDTDNDGLNDAQDGYLGSVLNGAVTPVTPPNTDTASEPTSAIRPDYLDIDSDNDGISDFYEAQTKASLISHSGVDANGNGLDDAFDPAAGATLITPTQTDGDAIADYLDDDSDADGFNDRLEGNNGDKNLYADWDTDTDGNFDDAGYNADTDEDGLLDIFDIVASQGNANVIGSNAALQDTDLDGTWDFQDVDDDNDGINTGGGDTNATNDDPNNIIPDYLYGDADADDDGVNDDIDLDSDNDGLGNSQEDGGTGIDPSLDLDGDGLYNYEDWDIDGDGTINAADTDTDGVNTTSFVDTNNDGVIDQFDKDLDGRPDYKDLDSDNDGIADILEFAQGLTDADNDGRVDSFTDLNGNGLNDPYDEYCAPGSGNAVSITGESGVDVANPATNALNGVDGNYAHLDDNGDYIDVYLGELLPSGSSININLDKVSGGGTITVNIFESTSATIPGGADFTPSVGTTQQDYGYVTSTAVSHLRIQTTSNANIAVYHISYSYSNPCGGVGVTIVPSDNDGDGLPNYLDLDSDADGISDNREAQAEGSYVAPVLTDTDGDGIIDVYDEDIAIGNALNPVNTDGTDNPDYLDTDSDNDGIGDVVEGWDADLDGLADWDTDGDNDPTDEGGYASDVDNDGISYLFDSSNGRGTVANITGTGAALQDTDSDNTRDFRDIDDDGDGIDTDAEDANTDLNWSNDFTQGGVSIPDYLFFPDFDEDGIINALDPDSDGDGIPNSIEYAGIHYANNSSAFDDDDGDGLFNYLDADATGFVDTNSDGVDDRLDRDRDGLPNFFDLDSDNDGIADATEATVTNYALASSITASSVSGTYGSPLSVVIDGDTDGNGEAQANHTDSDNEAWIEIDLGQVYDISTVNVWNRTDCCTDRADNFYVFASEVPFSGTSVAAALAQGGVTAILQGPEASTPSVFDFHISTRYIRVQLTETNFLHLAEVEVYAQALDTDGDGLPDFLDLDSDNDGITDNREAQSSLGYIAISNADTNDNGLKDVYDAANGGVAITPIDTDSDGTPDYLDSDSDNDNVLDVIEGFDANKNGFSDLDIDQDADLADESGYGTDTDGDGLENIFDNYSGNGLSNITGSRSARQDTNGDGIPDWRDNEDDSDGINTASEDTSDGVGGGADGLYYNDKTQGGGATPDYLYFNDIDDDGIADGIDLDSDNDGIIDADEANGATYTGANGPFSDDDMDGLFNYLDADATNFVDANNNGIDDRVDADGDGIPNFFDLDSDNDGIPDGVEANSGVLPAGQNSNGQFPPSAADADNDGIADNVDIGNSSSLANPDTDGDGLPDFLDLDSDSDGITDLLEAGGNDFNGDGKLDGFGDTDGDGLGNSVDPGNGGTPLTYPNTDGIGAPDYIDTDTEGDGIRDFEEGFYEAGPIDYINSYINRVNSYNAANGASGHTLYPTIDLSPGDGRPDYINDSDGDGLPNLLDPQSSYFLDDDGDGLINVFDPDQNGNFYGNLSGQPDRDGDGTPNIYDTNDIPLPLDFLSFTGKLVNGMVELTWETTNEVNVSHFEVLHSTGGEQFDVIGTTDAVNTKHTLNTYTFDHTMAPDGYNFYRIKEVDFDGMEGLTKIISVVVEGSGITWTVFPNPTVDQVYIRSNVMIPTSRIMIMDMTGRILYDQQASFGSREAEVDMRRFDSGNYMMIIELPNGRESFRIIKR